MDQIIFRILMIVNGLGTSIRGGDLHAIKVAQSWAKTHEISFLSSRVGCSYLQDNCKPIICVTPFNWDSHVNYSIAASSILRIILRTINASLLNLNEKFNIIIASSHFPDDIIPAFFQHILKPGSKLITYCHGISIPMENSIKRALSLIYNMMGLLLAIKFTSIVFIVNDETRIYLSELGVDSKRIVSTSNGVDFEQCKYVTSEGIYECCFLGTCTKDKGIYDLINIWEKICTNYPKAKLAVIGGGPELEIVKALVKRKGLYQNIEFFGWLYDERKYKIIKGSSVFIFPSYLESWGMAIAEAMACGLPVVAYNLHIYTEIFNGKLIMVHLGDTDAMAKQVELLLDNPRMAKRIGDAGRESIQRYDWNVVAERELSEIIKLLRDSNSRDVM